jgi:hypothetical protein
MCKLMHIGQPARSFFFAAPVEQEYNCARTFSRLSEEQFPTVETQHPLRRTGLRKISQRYRV